MAEVAGDMPLERTRDQAAHDVDIPGIDLEICDLTSSNILILNRGTDRHGAGYAGEGGV
jgi:hypothetical protein